MNKPITKSIGQLGGSTLDVASNSISIVANLGSILGNTLGLVDVGLESGAEIIKEYADDVEHTLIRQRAETTEVRSAQRVLPSSSSIADHM